MYSNDGLSDVYEHFIDDNGIKYYTTYNRFYGTFIRQLKTPDGLMLDGSTDNLDFKNKLLELGFTLDQHDLFNVYDNWNMFKYRTEHSNSGIPNKPELVR
jgi:hypothetical protein